jgi:hypothetical protein
VLSEKSWLSPFVAAAADPYPDASAHQEVCAAIDPTSLIIDGADHGLVVHGDVRAMVAGFRTLAPARLRFGLA